MPCFKRKGRNSFSVISPATNEAALWRKISISCRTVLSYCESRAWRSERVSCAMVAINHLQADRDESLLLYRDYQIWRALGGAFMPGTQAQCPATESESRSSACPANRRFL